MDNPCGAARAWGPSPALVAAGWLLAAGAATALAFSVISGDRPGTLLLACVTVALLALAAHGTFVRPRLTADARGLRVRTLGGTRRLDWPRAHVRLVTISRFGRRRPVLEIDSPARQADPPDTDTDTDTDELTVFGWVELGADPRDVYDELTTLRRSSPGA